MRGFCGQQHSPPYTKLASSFHDAGSESLLHIGKTERAILGYEETVGAVNVLGLAVGEQGMEDHDGSAVHNEAHLAPEGMVQPLREIGEHLHEQLVCGRNIIHIFRS